MKQSQLIVVGVIVAIVGLVGIYAATTSKDESTKVSSKPKITCKLADISEVATEAFIEQGKLESTAADRCAVPGDETIIAWTKVHNHKIDGVVLFDGGKTVYHTSNGSDCTVLVGYLSNEQS